MKKLIYSLVLAGIVGTGFWYYKSKNTEKKNPEIEKLNVVEVKKDNLKKSVSSTGKIVPNLEVEIKCKASGEIVSLPFDISDEVKKGDLLLKLDPKDENRNVLKAAAVVNQTEANIRKVQEDYEVSLKALETDKKNNQISLKNVTAKLNDVKLKYTSNEKLFKEGGISKNEYENSKSSVIQAETEVQKAKTLIGDITNKTNQIKLKLRDLDIQKAKLDSDKLNLSDSKQKLTDTEVFSPIKGIISERNVQIGQIIASGINSVNGGTTVLKIADLSRIFVNASVDESDIGEIEEGQRVRVTLDAFPKMFFKGKVVQIATKGATVSNVVTFSVKIEIDDEKKSMLKPEMTANVEIVQKMKRDILTVPNDAVIRKRGKKIVKVLLPDEKVVEKEVEVGMSDSNNTEIISGLKEKDKVVAGQKEGKGKWKNQGGINFGMPPGGGGSGGRNRIM
ncbi:MAG: efflux RND transporter periplasmic adaptor subunit [Candidatus Sericytochromatia bacterium]